MLEATARLPRRDGARLRSAPRGQVVHERLDTDDPHRRSYFERNRDFIQEVAPLEAALIEDPIQVMFSGRVGHMRDAGRARCAACVAAQIAVAVTEYESRDFSPRGRQPPGLHEGRDALGMGPRQGLTRDEVMAVGDNLNDRDMLEFAGLPVVMGNAVEA